MNFEFFDFLKFVDILIVCNVIEVVEGWCGFNCFIWGIMLCLDFGGGVMVGYV